MLKKINLHFPNNEQRKNYEAKPGFSSPQNVEDGKALLHRLQSGNTKGANKDRKAIDARTDCTAIRKKAAG
jgi:hypothetical protein